MLSAARKQFGESGKERIRHTLPSVVMATVRLAGRFRVKLDTPDPLPDAEKKMQALFKFMHQTVMVIIVKVTVLK